MSLTVAVGLEDVSSSRDHLATTPGSGWRSGISSKYAAARAEISGSK